MVWRDGNPQTYYNVVPHGDAASSTTLRCATLVVPHQGFLGDQLPECARRPGVLRDLGYRAGARGGRQHRCAGLSLSFNKWPFFSSPALAGNLLYIGSHAGKLIAIDLKGRRVAWTFQTDGARKNEPALTRADGSPNYEAAFSDLFYDDLIVGVDRMMSVGAVLSSPVLHGDTLYFGSWDGQLYAIG